MKKSGVLHSNLMRLISLLGHTDTILISDAGMPIPKEVELIELALIKNVPTFNQVLDAILNEIEVEEYFLAKETEKINNEQYTYISKTLESRKQVLIPHEEIKEMSKNCKFAIKTGEHSPYANIILKMGVTF